MRINFMRTFTTVAADKAVLYEFTDYAHSANYNSHQLFKICQGLYEYSYSKVI